MDPALFRRFCAIARDQAGIRLKEGKEALVAARIARRLRALRLRSEERYIEYLEADDSGDELVNFLDVISTNVTAFFRERDHFARLADLVACRIADGHRRLRFWSAGCSSGEEAYSMAITVAEVVQGRDVDFRVLATDISTRVLAQARAGVYDDQVLGPVSRGRKATFFSRVASGPSGEMFEVHPDLKNHVVFKRMNLAVPPFPMRGPLDAVFCRNVMIYFDANVRGRLVAEMERLLRPGGLLFTSHTESLSGLRTGLELVEPSMYRRP